MQKKFILPFAALFLMPVLLTAAPAGIYGKALQKARNVAGQAERSRAIAPEKSAVKPAVPQAPDRLAAAKDFSRELAKAKLKSYPASGAAGINELLKKKIVSSRFFGTDVKVPVTEKKLPVAWFGTEANLARAQGVFPLFVTKPASGPVIAGFTDGSVIQLKQRPRTVTGVINILRSTAKNKKSTFWIKYRNAAGKIDKASK